MELVVVEEVLAGEVVVLVVVAEVEEASRAAVASPLDSGSYSYNLYHIDLYHQDSEARGSSSPPATSCDFDHHRQQRNHMELEMLHQVHGASLPFHPPKATRISLH